MRSDIRYPFGLSLSRPSSRTTLGTLRHGAFDKLSPLLRANGCFPVGLSLSKLSPRIARIVG